MSDLDCTSSGQKKKVKFIFKLTENPCVNMMYAISFSIYDGENKGIIYQGYFYNVKEFSEGERQADTSTSFMTS